MDKEDLTSTNTQITNQLTLIESHLLSRISTPDEIKSQITSLRSFLDQVKHTLPPYQIQQYSNKINDLMSKTDMLSSGATKRFKFSARKSSIPKKEKKISRSEPLSQEAMAPTIYDKSNEYLKVTELNPIIKNVSYCIIDIRDINSLQVFDVSNSIIIVRNNRSSNFFKRVKNSTMFLGNNEQTRLHNIENCKISLFNPQKIVIEDSKSLKVSEGALVDDFNSPLGNSTNFELVEFSESFWNILEGVDNDPINSQNKLNGLLELI